MVGVLARIARDVGSIPPPGQNFLLRVKTQILFGIKLYNLLFILKCFCQAVLGLKSIPLYTVSILSKHDLVLACVNLN